LIAYKGIAGAGRALYGECTSGKQKQTTENGATRILDVYREAQQTVELHGHFCKSDRTSAGGYRGTTATLPIGLPLGQNDQQQPQEERFSSSYKVNR
jgi:hypothetical protein